MQKFYFVVFFCVLCASSCAAKTQIALENLPRAKPLNELAVSGVIDPAVNDTAFFKADGIFQIEAEFSFLGEAGEVFAGFLRSEDFAGKKLRFPLNPEREESCLFFSEGESGDAKSFSFVSQKFGGEAKGFYIRAKVPVQLEKIAGNPNSQAAVLFKNEGGRRFYNLENCGKIDASKDILRLSSGKSLQKSDAIEIRFSDGSKNPLSLHFGEKKFDVHLKGAKSKIVFPIAALGGFEKNPQVFLQKDDLKFVLQAEICSLGEFWSENLQKKAIPVDPGLILSWPSAVWRDEDCEIFCSRFGEAGEVIFFDFRNYAVQDDYLKRLAFFSEKTGWRGKIPDVEAVASSHAFNAHDYKSEVLARFFNLAEESKISLTNGEQKLAEFLVANEVIFWNGKSFFPNEKKAIVSISQESAAWTRRLLLTHEGFHGIYFLDGEFRAVVERVFNSTDEKSRQFLADYFRANPTLDYDAEDAGLMKNEFMAYILQSPLEGRDSVRNYFVNRLANSRNVNRLFPKSAEYVKETDGKAFTDAARAISAFLQKKYGFESGRICRVESAL